MKPRTAAAPTTTTTVYRLAWPRSWPVRVVLIVRGAGGKGKANGGKGGGNGVNE